LKRLPTASTLATCIALTCTSAIAHITLPPGGAAANTDYEAVFRVGHACKDARATTGVTVRLPKGFAFTDAQARKGWRMEVDPTGDAQVRWTAVGEGNALPDAERAEFIVRGKVTAAPGTLYFKVLQTCDSTSADWAQLPGAPGAEKVAFPAARLDVLAPGVAPVDVKDAWIRPSVPGQGSTGAFMKLYAPSGARLVGVSTPLAGVAGVHEMKMDGDIMKMREVGGGVELPPRQTVELKPGGYHVMLMDLKQTLQQGANVPMTLIFEDAKGVRSTAELLVPVGTPEGAAAETHRH
jgi:copper(I)-binding protein